MCKGRTCVTAEEFVLASSVKHAICSILVENFSLDATVRPPSADDIFMMHVTRITKKTVFCTIYTYICTYIYAHVYKYIDINMCMRGCVRMCFCIYIYIWA